MSKAKRLVELIMVVNSKKRFNVQELSNEFGVSYRTILRDLQELGEIGVPLYSELGANGGYRLLKERLLPPISFTESEAVSIFFVAQSLKYYKNLPFENESKSALKKFYHYLPDEVKKSIDELNKRLSFNTSTINLEVPYLKDLLNASTEQNIISIEYDSEKSLSKREVQPIGVYTMKGLWYAPAYCFKSSDFRLFRIDRIKGISFENIKSEKIDLDNFTISHWFKYNKHDFNLNDEIDLVVKLTKKGVKKCDTDLWVSENIILNEDGSGTLKTKIPECFVYWIVNYFISCGKDAIVEEPVFVRELIKKELQEMIANY